MNKTLNEQAEQIFNYFIDLSSGSMDKEIIDACRKEEGGAHFSILVSFARKYNAKKCADIYIDGLIKNTQTIFIDLGSLIEPNYFLNKVADLIQIKAIIKNL